VLGLRAGEGYYHLIDTTSGKQIRLNYAEAQFVSDAVLLVRDADEIQHLWRMPDGVIHTFGVSETVRHVAISPDGRRMAYTNRYPGDVLLWDLSSGAPALLHQLLDENGVSAPYSYYTNVIAFSPDGRILAAAGDPEIRLWDVETGELLAVLEGHAEAVEALVFSPDGTLIASSGSGANDGAFEVISQEKVIHLWGIPQNPS
jgi:WD40 repeat protein